jgi:hypothetical protein
MNKYLKEKKSLIRAEQLHMQPKMFGTSEYNAVTEFLIV